MRYPSPPLPYPESDRLVQLSYQSKGSMFGPVLAMADVHWIELRDRTRLLSSAAAWYGQLGTSRTLAIRCASRARP